MNRYDCAIKDSKGKWIGLTLFRDRGVPRYMETTDPGLAQQYFIGLAGYANLEPQKQMQIGQDDWRGGFGQEYQDYTDPARYYTAKNVDARFKNMIVAGAGKFRVAVPNGKAITSMVEFNSALYIGADKTLYKYTVDGLEALKTFNATITDLEPFVDDNLYIALGDSEKFQYMSKNESFSASTETDGYASFFKMVGDVLWKAVQPNELKSSTNPSFNSTTDWSTQTPVGSTFYNITGLIEESGTLYIMKEDHPYYLDSSGNPQFIMSELKSELTETSGRNAIVWQSRIYIPCGEQSLYEYDNGIITNISPSKYITSSLDYSGKVKALVADSQWLFAILDDDEKVQVLAGRWEEIDGTRWVWHPISELDMVGASFAYLFANKMFIGSSNDGQDIQLVSVPKRYGDISLTDDYLFESGGELITSWLHGNFMSDCKAWYKISLTMAGTSAGSYFRVYYQKLGDTDWIEIAPETGFKFLPVQTEYFPVDYFGNDPSSTMIRLKIMPFTGNPHYWVLGESELGNDTMLAYYNRSPRLINYDIRALWYPEQSTYITCQVRASDNILLLNGQVDEEQSARDIRNAIEDLRDAKWLRDFRPPHWKCPDDTRKVKLHPPVDYTIIKDDKTNKEEYVYTLNMQVVKTGG